MSSSEIRKKFLEYFKKRGHTVVPSSSLIPDDPSVLLTTAGMQQFKKYYTGELDPMRDFKSKSTASAQKCFRTGDIDEVGDESHLTFFEMLGNFSFGGYFKEEAIQYGHEFITREMGLDIEYVTVFDPAQVPDGDWRKNGVPRDDQSREIWKKLGLPESKIRAEGTDVFWGPTGSEGPCGPTTEIYVKNASGNAIEVWNIVFNEYYCDKDRKLTKVKTPGVDTGMGLERLAMVVQKKKNIFETDLFDPVISQLPDGLPAKEQRILADHVRGIIFLLADGVRPSNKEAGYMLRRLMRAIILIADMYNLDVENLLTKCIDYYSGFYENLDDVIILNEYNSEKIKFAKTLMEGKGEAHRKSVELKKEIEEAKINDVGKKVGDIAFDLYQSHGFPVTGTAMAVAAQGIVFPQATMEKEFDERFHAHQKQSAVGQEKKFGGHGLILDTGELKAGSEEELKKVTRLHTATHLLHQALRQVLGDSVRQMGSDITVERTRFDYTFSRKMTPEEVKKVEEIANQKVAEKLPVSFKEMPLEEAEKTGALHFFKTKYPSRVKVYFVGNSLETAFSKEFCGGPHVTNTSEIGRIRIIKDEASSAGVRRIRATVE